MFISKKIRISLVAAAAVLGLLCSTFSPLVANAAPDTYTADDLLKRAQAWSIINGFLHYSGVNGGPNKLDNSSANAQNCDIFGHSDDKEIIVGSYVTQQYGESGVLQNPYSSWYYIEDGTGLANATAALAAAGIQGGCAGLLIAAGANPDFQHNNDMDRSKMLANLQAKITPGFFTGVGANLGDPYPGDAIAYVILRNGIEGECGWSYKGQYNPNDANDLNSVQAKAGGHSGNSPNAYYHIYTADSGQAQDNVFYRGSDSAIGTAEIGTASSLQGLGAVGGNGSTNLNCASSDGTSYGDRLSDKKYATAYAALVKGEAGVGICSAATDPNCKAGGQGTTCNVEGIGWIVCPVINFIANLNDVAFNFIKGWLATPPDIFTPAEKAWEKFRDIANVLFLIVFLIVVYSQVTGGGLTNYTLKKMLPKLILAAILVNSSLLLCKVAVDVSNVLGFTLKDFMETLQVQDAGQVASWKVVAGNVLGFVGIGLIAIALLALVIFAPVILLILAVTFLALIIRQVLITLLIVVSPVAFVLFLLPNTEQWFKKWWKMFSTLLLLFPTISLLFGAGALATNIITQVGASQGGSETIDGWLKDILGLGVGTLPLLFTPTLVVKALQGFGALGTKIANLQNRANSRAKQGVKSGRLGEAKRAFDARRQARKVDRRLGNGRLATWGRKRGPDSRIGRAAEFLGSRGAAFDRSGLGQRLGGSRGQAAAVAEQHKAFDEEVARQKALVSGKSNEELLAALDSGKGTAESRAAIAGTLMSRNHRESHLKALEIIGRQARQAEAQGNAAAAGDVSSIQKQMAHDMKDKPFALGDQAAGQLVDGTYGRSKDAQGKVRPPQQRLGDINNEFKDRLGSKLSAAGLADLNPDELKLAHRMATNGELSESQLGNLRNAITTAEGDPRLSVRIKPEAAALHADILRSANNAATYDEAAAANLERDHEEALMLNSLHDMDNRREE